MSLELERCFPVVVLVFDEVLGAPFCFLIVELHAPNRREISVSRWEEFKEGAGKGDALDTHPVEIFFTKYLDLSRKQEGDSLGTRVQRGLFQYEKTSGSDTKTEEVSRIHS